MRYIWRVVLDTDPTYADPRDNDNLSEFALAHGRYDLPNDSGLRLTDYAEFEDLVAAIESIGGRNIVPVWMLDHSGTTVRAGVDNPFGDPWDSGLVGVAYTTAARLEAMGTPDDKIDECIKAEVDEYGRWMSGEVYTATVFDTFKREDVESIGGIIGHEWAEQEAMSMAAFWNKTTTEGVA